MLETIENAIIESVSLMDSEHGALTAFLMLKFDGSGQGFGGYALYNPNPNVNLMSYCDFCGHFIWRCLEIGGVGEWKDLQGKTIRVKKLNGLIQAIGHIVKNDWFDPAKDFNNIKEK